ncbi:MAG: hypothetical protein Q4A44_04170 [Bacteroidales bacterium]|nr:hypothetical protein [Bacteroidales bacterium]
MKKRFYMRPAVVAIVSSALMSTGNPILALSGVVDDENDARQFGGALTEPTGHTWSKPALWEVD